MVTLALKVIFCYENVLPRHYRIRFSEEPISFLSLLVMAIQFSLKPTSPSQESLLSAALRQRALKAAGAGAAGGSLCRMSLAVWSLLSQALALAGLGDFPETGLLTLRPELLWLLTAVRGHELFSALLLRALFRGRLCHNRESSSPLSPILLSHGYLCVCTPHGTNLNMQCSGLQDYQIPCGGFHFANHVCLPFEYTHCNPYLTDCNQAIYIFSTPRDVR